MYANGLLPLILGVMDDRIFKFHQYMVQKGAIEQNWEAVAQHALGTIVTVLEAPNRALNKEHRASKLNKEQRKNLSEAAAALGRPDVARLSQAMESPARGQTKTASTTRHPRKITPEKSDDDSEGGVTTESFKVRYGAKFPRNEPSSFAKGNSSKSKSESGYEYSEEENEEPAADAESLEDLARQANELGLDGSSDDDTASVGQEETGYIARAEEDDVDLGQEAIEALRSGYKGLDTLEMVKKDVLKRPQSIKAQKGSGLSDADLYYMMEVGEVHGTPTRNAMYKKYLLDRADTSSPTPSMLEGASGTFGAESGYFERVRGTAPRGTACLSKKKACHVRNVLERVVRDGPSDDMKEGWPLDPKYFDEIEGRAEAQYDFEIADRAVAPFRRQRIGKYVQRLITNGGVDAPSTPPTPCPSPEFEKRPSVSLIGGAAEFFGDSSSDSSETSTSSDEGSDVEKPSDFGLPKGYQSKGKDLKSMYPSILLPRLGEDESSDGSVATFAVPEATVIPKADMAPILNEGGVEFYPFSAEMHRCLEEIESEEEEATNQRMPAETEELAKRKREEKEAARYEAAKGCFPFGAITGAIPELANWLD